MAFFSNRAVNRLQLHTGFQALAQGSGGLFVFSYLLKSGVPTGLVFCCIAGMTFCRFGLRPMVLPLARRVGLRWVLILGTVGESGIFPLLPNVHGPGSWLLLTIIVGAVGSVLYWTSYHAYFAAVGDMEHRGDQVAIREAMIAVIRIVAPAAGGLAIAVSGPRAAFGAIAIVQLLAVIPLFGAPSVRVVGNPREGRAEYLRGALLQSADGWLSAGYTYVWPVALFIVLKERFAVLGGSFAAAALIGALGSVGVGRLVDLGHGRRSVSLTYGLGAIAVIVMSVSLPSPPLAIFANVLATIAATLFIPVMMARVYNLSKISPCPLRFSIATEGGWDLGCGFGCLACAGLFALGAPLGLLISTSLLGVVVSATLLASGYGPSTSTLNVGRRKARG